MSLLLVRKGGDGPRRPDKRLLQLDWGGAAAGGRRSGSAPAPGETASVLAVSAASPARMHLHLDPPPLEDNPAQIIHRLH